MKKIVVIGAGISGLSAAIYARRSGFDVTLCEQHSIAGGMCTSWKRKGYLFEGAVHWLTGSSPKTELYQLWNETGALNENVKVLLPDPFAAVEHEGMTINLFRDIDKTVKHLIEISPDDKAPLLRLSGDVKAFSNVQMPVYDIKGVKAHSPKKMKTGTLLKMMPALPKLGKLRKMSCKEYIQRFKHSGIRRLLNIVPEDFSALSLAATLATLYIGDGGYPEGGSLAMTERMAKTFISLGGRLLFNKKVKKINIENGEVNSVTLESETLAADAVIVTQETIAAVNQLFDIPLNDAWLADLRKNTKPMVCTFISMGINAQITQKPVPAWLLDEPIVYAGSKITEIGFYNYYGYNGYAPECADSESSRGAPVTTAFMGDTYDFWKKAKDEGRYDEEKKNLADQVVRAFCRKYPQAEGKIDVIDIATPLTYERFTGAFHGSWMSAAVPGEKMKYYPGFLDGVKGVYFAGHRLMSPGGLPVAILSGRNAAQMVCRQFDAVFK